MKTECYSAVPTTLALLTRIKRPAKPPTIFDRIERVVFTVTLALASIMLVAAGLGAVGALSKEVIRFLTMTILVSALALFLIWAVSQIVEMLLGLRTGFRDTANRVDDDIEHDNSIIRELADCDPFSLREMARHMEAKAKRLTRQASMGPIIAAIGVVAINFHDSAEKAELFARVKTVPLFIYSGSLGVLLGAAALTVLAGKLEHIGTLLGLAADRADR